MERAKEAELLDICGQLVGIARHITNLQASEREKMRR